MGVMDLFIGFIVIVFPTATSYRINTPIVAR